MDVGQAVVLGRVERRAANVVRGREARLGLDRADHDLLGGLGDQLGAVRLLAVLSVLGHELEQLVDRRSTCSLEQSRLLEERDHALAVGGAQRRGPALVLLEQPREPLPARLGQLERLVVAVVDLDLLELVAEQDLLEVGLALDVAVLLPAGQPVQRRLGDVHVAGLDQRLHLAEQQRQRERADVGAVDVGVGQQHDLVVAGLGRCRTRRARRCRSP